MNERVQIRVQRQRPSLEKQSSQPIVRVDDKHPALFNNLPQYSMTSISPINTDFRTDPALIRLSSVSEEATTNIRYRHFIHNCFNRSFLVFWCFVLYIVE